MSVELRDYQLKIVEQALPHRGFGLFMEQRTGKTLTALWLSREWGCNHILVICPKKAIPVWKDEIRKLGLSEDLFSIINFESFRINQQTYLRDSWDLVIVDESHRMKERSSQQTKAIWKLSKRSDRRLILTGTPQGNGMEDYYAQLKFIRPDLFPSWKKFSDEYLIIEEQWRMGQEDPFPKIVGYKNQEKFQQILVQLSARKTRDEDAAVKTLVRIRKHYVTPSEALLTHYRAIEKDLYTLIQGNMISAPMALTQALKLHQLCGGYIKDDMGELQHVHDDRINYLWDLMDGELKGKSVAIVCQYKAEMDAVARGLTRRGITHVQIRGGKRHQYNPADRSQVTILNPSAGEAINLAHHSVMVIYSMNYSYLKWAQFKDRIVVVDTPQVQYHYLLMKGLMDEIVYDTVIEKKKLSDRIMTIYKQ